MVVERTKSFLVKNKFRLVVSINLHDVHTHQFKRLQTADGFGSSVFTVMSRRAAVTGGDNSVLVSLRK